jgi:serine/threonine protein kinase
VCCVIVQLFLIVGHLLIVFPFQISDLKEKKVRVDCLKEVKLLEKLHHTNIIRYFCSFVEESDVYIVLELAEAGDLARLILVSFSFRLLQNCIFIQYSFSTTEILLA